MASGGIAQGPNSKPVNKNGQDYQHPDNKNVRESLFGKGPNPDEEGIINQKVKAKYPEAWKDPYNATEYEKKVTQQVIAQRKK
jgi:hypothetical protein